MTEEQRRRVPTQISRITEMYKRGRAEGLKPNPLGLSYYDSQKDYEQFQPLDAPHGSFRDFNEYAAEILKGAQANGVPAELVLIHYAVYSQWLSGRENTSANRATFTAYLLAIKDAGTNIK